MKPSDVEIEQVGQSIIALTNGDYSMPQCTAIHEFLKGHALDLNDVKMSKIFSNQLQVMDAIRTLHEFAFQFQSEEELFDEFVSNLDQIADMITASDSNSGFAGIRV